MAANEIHIGDIGTVFEVTVSDNLVAIDLTLASVMQIIFVKPDATKTKVINAAARSTDGTDGKMRYVVTLASEIDIKGTWKIQGLVTLPSGTWSTDIGSFKVYENL